MLLQFVYALACEHICCKHSQGILPNSVRTLCSIHKSTVICNCAWECARCVTKHHVLLSKQFCCRNKLLLGHNVSHSTCCLPTSPISAAARPAVSFGLLRHCIDAKAQKTVCMTCIPTALLAKDSHCSPQPSQCARSSHQDLPAGR